MLRGLAAHGLTVTTVAPLWQGGVMSAPPPDLDVEVVALGPAPVGARSLTARLRQPIAELAAESFAAVVQQRARNVDVVHLDQIETAPLAALTAGVPTALHLHYRARLDAPLGPPWQPEFRDRAKFVLAERGAVRAVRWLIANTPEVAASFTRRGRQAPTVVPLPLDPLDYESATHEGPPRLGIIGTASWAPTAAAMRRLIEDVWPLVVARVPDGELLVAGRGCAALDSGVARRGVRFLGEVESASQFLRSLSVLAYPPARGSGTKVKVLEALASAVPVVVTRPGAEGLEPNDGLIVESSDDAIAGQIVSLLLDPDERRRRGAAGRAYITRRHAPVPSTEPLVALYGRMLA
jgi:glycosyltransferase involved in cell wall biosynthesis